MPDAKILLIEDDREIAATLRSVLQAAGYTIEWVQNGKEGKRVIDEWNPHLVITDMMMPQLGGFPVLDHLKTLPAETRPRVIMITANEGGRHKAFAELMGVDDYLRKPFAMDLLLDAVDDYLRKPFAMDLLLDAVSRSLAKKLPRSEVEDKTKRTSRKKAD